MNTNFAFVLSAFILGFSQILAQLTCQTCMPTNDAYCIDDTSYYLCLDGRNPSNSTLRKCGRGQVCTDSVNICETERSSGGVVTRPACKSSCGVCPDSAAAYQRYTCLSRTQFGRCVQNAVTITGQCEDGHMCSSELYAKTGVICAPNCVIDFFDVSASCGSEEVITTTTTTAAPVETESIKKQCEDALPNHSKDRIFYITNANDNECTTYLFCEKFGDEVDGLLVKCASGNYFDPSVGKCGNVKPLVCNQTPSALTTTTTPAPTTPTTDPTTMITAPTTTTTDSTTTTTSHTTTTTDPTTTITAPTTTTTDPTTTTTAHTTMTTDPTTTITAPTITTADSTLGN